MNTLGLGQIHSDLGPWISAGPSTARLVYHPSAEVKTPTFGSPHVGGAYFANCDAYTYFLDMAKTNLATLRCLAARSDGRPIPTHEIPRYGTATEWKASR